MCCHIRSARRSCYRRPQRPRLTLLRPLAVLDLNKPFERQAHEFLCRATSKSDRMWKLYSLQRQGDVLLCVVQWAHPESATQPFSLVEVSLTASAVRWQYYASVEAARAEMERRSTAPVSSEGAALAAVR